MQSCGLVIVGKIGLYGRDGGSRYGRFVEGEFVGSDSGVGVV